MVNNNRLLIGKKQVRYYLNFYGKCHSQSMEQFKHPLTKFKASFENICNQLKFQNEQVQIAISELVKFKNNLSQPKALTLNWAIVLVYGIMAIEKLYVLLLKYA